jgi:hypothetical protein
MIQTLDLQMLNIAIYFIDFAFIALFIRYHGKKECEIDLPKKPLKNEPRLLPAGLTVQCRTCL